jgi:hypothetical protein
MCRGRAMRRAKDGSTIIGATRTLATPQYVAYQSEETEVAEGALHSWDIECM